MTNATTKTKVARCKHCSRPFILNLTTWGEAERQAGFCTGKCKRAADLLELDFPADIVNAVANNS